MSSLSRESPLLALAVVVDVENLRLIGGLRGEGEKEGSGVRVVRAGRSLCWLHWLPWLPAGLLDGLLDGWLAGWLTCPAATLLAQINSHRLAQAGKRHTSACCWHLLGGQLLILVSRILALTLTAAAGRTTSFSRRQSAGRPLWFGLAA